MRSERGGPVTGFLISIGAIVVFFGLLAVACGACTSNSKDKGHSLGRIQLIRYDDGGDCDWDGDCGNSGYNDGGYGQGRNSGGGGGNGNRGRKGDRQDSGRDSCHSFCGNTIIVPDPTQKKDPPPKDQQPQSLTDPRKLPAVVAQIAKAGLDMGQLFATTTIKFVETLFTALA